MAAKDEEGNEGMLGGLIEIAELLQEMLSQDHDDQGGENKLNSDETSSDEQGTSNHQLAGLSATYNALVAYKKRDQVGDSDAIRDQVGDSDLASKYNLPDDEEVTNPIDYSSSDYDALRDQLQGHFSQLSIENGDDSNELGKIDSSSSDHLETEQALHGTREYASDLTFDVRQPVNPEQAPPKPRLQRQNAMRPQRYTSELDPVYSASSLNQPMPKPRLQRQNAMPRQRYTRELDPGYSASSLNQPMPTRQSITTASSHGRRPPISMAKALTTATDYDAIRYQLSLLSVENDDSKEFAQDASLKPYMSKIDSSSSDHLEAEQALHGTHEHASDSTFDVRQPVNPPKPRLQRQNAMQRQRYTSELDPGYTASYLIQPMPTRVRPSASMTNALTTATDFVPQRNQQAMMDPHNSEWQYGNITNSLYLPPNQNEGYNNMTPSAAAASQQLGGSTNNNTSAHYGSSPYWRPDQNDSYNYNMPPQSAASVAPNAYGSVNFFGTSSDNVADSRFGYDEGGVSRNHLPPIQQHQSGGDSNVWRPSSRRSQRQQLWSDFFATQYQQDDRSDDPSD